MSTNDLILACMSGNLSKVKHLIAKGISVNPATSQLFYAPLEMASVEGHLEIVKYLIDQGADVESSNNWSVRSACRRGHFDIVKYLVDKGADVTADDNNAIKMAVRANRLDIIKYLVAVGADPDCAVEVALKLGYFEMVDYLISAGVDISYVRFTALNMGIEGGDLKKIEYAVSLGCNVVHYSILKHPIEIAKEKGYVRICEFLIDIVISEMKKHTVLELLSQKKTIHKDLIELIIKKMFRYLKHYHKYQRKF